MLRAALGSGALFHVELFLVQIYSDSRSPVYGRLSRDAMSQISADSFAEIQPYSAGSLVDSAVISAVSFFKDARLVLCCYSYSCVAYAQSLRFLHAYAYLSIHSIFQCV